MESLKLDGWVAIAFLDCFHYCIFLMWIEGGAHVLRKKGLASGPTSVACACVAAHDRQVVLLFILNKNRFKESRTIIVHVNACLVMLA
jgi:hypothetical protein